MLHRLVGHLHVNRIAIGIRIDRNRGDPHLARGFDDAAGDFATVGNQDFLEHSMDLPIRPCFYCQSLLCSTVLLSYTQAPAPGDFLPSRHTT